MNKFTLIPVCILSMGLSACAPGQVTGSLGAAGSLFKGATISKQELVASSQLSAKEMDKKAKVAPASSKYAKRLAKLTKNLTSYDGLTLNYKVYLAKDINAFAMPDGTVRVYSGLMDLMNDNEIVSVIGHEIGHVAHEHSLNQYRKAYMTQAAKQGATAAGGTTGLVASVLGDVSEDFLNAQFSQSDELESDTYGVKLLHKLGRNPYAAVSAQEKLQKLGGEGSVFSSHPSSQKRIDLAREAADKISGK